MRQRPDDGYINATELCQRAGNLFAGYKRLTQTQAFIEELPADMGIPISGNGGPVQIRPGGNNQKSQGTWVHPHVAINLGQ